MSALAATVNNHKKNNLDGIINSKDVGAMRENILRTMKNKSNEAHP